MRKLILLFHLILLFACQSDDKGSARRFAYNKDIEKPEKLIDKEKMALILADIHIAEAATGGKKKEDKGMDSITQVYYEQIFKKYDLAPEEFYKSYQYYTNNSALIKDIYEEVVEVLSKKEARARSEIDDNSKKPEIKDIIRQKKNKSSD